MAKHWWSLWLIWGLSLLGVEFFQIMLRARGKYGKYRKEWICWDNFYIGWFFIVLCFNSVNIKHQLKSKLACVLCVQRVWSLNMVQEQWLQLKICFYLVITWKLWRSGGGVHFWWGNENLLGWIFPGVEISKFLASRGGGDSPIPPVRKPRAYFRKMKRWGLDQTLL